MHARDLLSRIQFLRPAMDIPYCHHEKWDGSGYPQGLAGEEIPLAARIFTVADIWDALSNDRPYRKAWPPGRVIEYIASLAGTLLDPRSSKTFLRLQANQPQTSLGQSANELLRTSTGPWSPEVDQRHRSRASRFPRPQRLEVNPTVAVSDPLRLGSRSGSTGASPPESDRARRRRRPSDGQHAEASARAHGPSLRLGGLRRPRSLAGDPTRPSPGGDRRLAAPLIDGRELCRRIRSEAQNTWQPLMLILTGEKPRADLHPAQNLDELPADADDFLARPIDLRDLTTRMTLAGRFLSTEAMLLDRTVQAKRMYVELRDQNERLCRTGCNRPADRPEQPPPSPRSPSRRRPPSL